MSTRSLIRIFVMAFVLSAGTLPLFAYGYHQCVGNSILWGSNWENLRAANVSFPDTTTRNALAAAIGSWNFAPGTQFYFGLSFENLSAATMPNWSNEVIFTTTGFDDEYAITHWWSGCGTLHETDIHFNANYTWTFDQNPTTLPVSYSSPISFPLVAVHEVGHAIGLKHQTNTMAMMAPYYPNGGVVGQGTQQHFQPLADDVHGDRVGYGTSGTAHDVYASAYRNYTDVDTDPIAPPSLVFRGRRSSFQFTVGNRGTTSETVPIHFYFSTDRYIDASDSYLGSATVSLAPGATSQHETVNVDLPVSYPAGNYYFGYIIDPYNGIGETDELNNAVAMGAPTQVASYTPPTACFTRNPLSGPAPLLVNFNATCSSDPDGYVTSYRWDFGDGWELTGPQVSYRFGSPGTYQVILTVTDNQGYTAEMIGTVFVYGSSGCLVCEE